MSDSCSILVVDDEPGIRDGCRRVLARAGYGVDTAPDGSAGLARYREGSFEAVLVDLRMPGLSGMELLKALRESDPDVVAVVITAFASLETAVEATKQGAYDYLAKPFTPDELLNLVRRACEHRRLLREARRHRDQRARDLLELSSERSRLRTVIDCMADGLLVVNRDGQLVLYNTAALRLLHETQLPLGAPIEECFATCELGALMAEGVRANALTRISRELPLVDKGVEAILLATAAPVHDEGGENLGLIVLLRDITELKTVERMTASFVRMVSHELRAPLGVIRNYLEVMLGDDTSGDRDRDRKMMDRMRRRADAMLALVDDLLLISRLDHAPESRTIAPVPLHELLSETQQFFHEEAESAGLRLVLSPGSEDLWVMADREELGRALTNLLSNAIKYNRPGGSVTLSAATQGQQVAIRVADTGLGIAPEAMQNLGREFFRIKSPETRDIVGTGLGLSVVKRILEAHHGRLEIASELGTGSTFTVLVPRAEVRVPEAREGAST